MGHATSGERRIVTIAVGSQLAEQAQMLAATASNKPVRIEKPPRVAENSAAKVGNWFSTDPNDLRESILTNLGAVDYDIANAGTLVNALIDLTPNGDDDGLNDSFLLYAADAASGLRARRELLVTVRDTLYKPYGAAASWETGNAAVRATEAISTTSERIGLIRNDYAASSAELAQQASTASLYYAQVHDNLDAVAEEACQPPQVEGYHTESRATALKDTWRYMNAARDRLWELEANPGEINGSEVPEFVWTSEKSQAKSRYEGLKDKYNEVLCDICVNVFNPLRTTASTPAINAQMQQSLEQVQSNSLEEELPLYARLELLLQELGPVIDSYIAYVASKKPSQSTPFYDSQQVLSGIVIDNPHTPISAINEDKLPSKVAFLLENIKGLVDRRHGLVANEDRTSATEYRRSTIIASDAVTEITLNGLCNTTKEWAQTQVERDQERVALGNEMVSHTKALQIAISRLDISLVALSVAVGNLVHTESSVRDKLYARAYVDGVLARGREETRRNTDELSRTSNELSDESLDPQVPTSQTAAAILGEAVREVVEGRKTLLGVLAECNEIGREALLAVSNDAVAMKKYYIRQVQISSKDNGGKPPQRQSRQQNTQKPITASTPRIGPEPSRIRAVGRVTDFLRDGVEKWDALLQVAFTSNVANQTNGTEGER